MARNRPHPLIASAESGWSVRRVLLLLLGIVALTLLAHLQSMQNGYIWDDDAHILDNINLRNDAGLARIWVEPRATPQYYPIVHSTFWMEYQLWGPHPFGYHLTNILLHAANALLVFFILRRLKIPGGEPAALLAAALFAVHPVHVESVAWITERKNVLSGLFYLLAILAAIRVWALDSASSSQQFKVRPYVLCFVCFILALLSKSVTASLPAVILLLVWWKHGSIRLRDVLYSVPLFIIGLVAGLHTAHLEKEHVGAVGEKWDFSFIERALIAGRALWTYLLKLVWPNPLAFFYERWKVDSHQWWQYLFPLAILLILVILWKYRARITRGPLTAAFFFIGTLFPALGFFNVFPFRYSFVADHFQYLASLGMLTLAACLLIQAGNYLSKRFDRRIDLLLKIAPLLLLGVLAAVSWRESFKYYDLASLWVDTLEKNPDTAVAHTNLGVEQVKRGNIAAALESYRKAVELDPGFYETITNIGGIYYREGNYAGAELKYREAVHVAPGFAPAVHGLGMALAQQGKNEEAVRMLIQATHLKPADEKYAHSLAVVLVRVGLKNEARAAYARTVALDPDDADVRLAYGRLLCALGNIRGGIEQFRQAVRIQPDMAEAKRDLAIAQQQLINPAFVPSPQPPSTTNKP